MSSSETQPTEIKESPPPPNGQGEEGTIAKDNDYFYLYTDGKWIRVAINTWTK